MNSCLGADRHRIKNRSLQILTRTATILILLCAFAGVLYFVLIELNNREAELAHLKNTLEDFSQKAPVVYAAHEIPEGSVIKPESLMLIMVQRSKIPNDAAMKISVVINKRAKYPIGRGQIVSRLDLSPLVAD